jgi:FSR family fosmidomycin resistance protein-like MFS transporter
MERRVSVSQTLMTTTARETRADQTTFMVLGALSVCHLVNDMMQSLLPSIFPLLKANYGLTFTEIGLLTFTYQITASLLQPLFGWYTDKKHQPRFLVVGMGISLLGLLLLAWAGNYAALLAAAGLVGMSSSVFHPDASRIARAASGGRHGMAQSLFQVGGNAGSAVGPLLVALFVTPNGQHTIAWFALATMAAMGLLWLIGNWAAIHVPQRRKGARLLPADHVALPRGRVALALGILGVLIFSKYFYLASLTNYYTFYLIGTFHLSVRNAQWLLFLFLGAVAVGTVIGGPIGDRISRKYVIWGSILGVLPFTVALPYASLFWTAVLTVVIGLVLASAFSAILVYAQELVPGRVGLVSGLFFGLAFGMGGLGAAVLGVVADHLGITFVYHVCSFLPALGLLTVFLPHLGRHAAKRA